MFNALPALLLGSVFFVLGDIFGIDGIIRAGKQIISHF